jgi:hypothetical protein
VPARLARRLDKGEPTCIGIAGQAVDRAVAKEMLRVVQPVTIEAARLASAERSRRVDEVVAALQRDLEAAHSSARRAQKHARCTNGSRAGASRVVRRRR